MSSRATLLRIASGAPWTGAGPKRQAFLASLLGGLLFVLIFEMAYDGIPDHLYQVRDDGVITMSHARNLVDYGFIGINPSGGRVEGYSAPVQLFLYAAAYAVTGVGYAVWSGAQTVAATFLLGVLLVLFFGERKLLAVGLTGVAALFLTLLRPFLLWHGSGMENAITHVLILATVLILFFLVRAGRMHYWLAVPVFLASISRVDGIFHVGPLLIVFGGVWLAAFRDWRGVRFSLLAAGLWVLFHWWRYLYFGDLLPNTAYAQDIPLADNLGLWLALDRQHMHEAVASAGTILDFHGAKVLALALPVLLMLSRRRETVVLALLLGSLLLTAAFSESVFGPARMDRARTTTHLAVVSALGISALFYHLMLRRRIRWAVPFVAVAGWGVFGTGMVIPPYKAGFSVDSFDKNRKVFARIASAEDLYRPTVANPDLGVMSWHKQFNVIDMGSLGSPLIARLAASSGAQADYFSLCRSGHDRAASRLVLPVRCRNPVGPPVRRALSACGRARDKLGQEELSGQSENPEWILDTRRYSQVVGIRREAADRPDEERPLDRVFARGAGTMPEPLHRAARLHLRRPDGLAVPSRIPEPGTDWPARRDLCRQPHGTFRPLSHHGLP